MLGGGAQHQVGILAERHVDALAVHLGSRGDDHELLLLVRVLEHHFGAVHVGLNRVNGRFDDELDADGRGEVEHDVCAVDELGQHRLVGHAVDHVAEPRTILEVFDVLHRAGGQVVEHRHLVSGAQQRVGQMRSDESGTAGYEGIHVRSGPRERRAHPAPPPRAGAADDHTAGLEPGAGWRVVSRARDARSDRPAATTLSTRTSARQSGVCP